MRASRTAVRSGPANDPVRRIDAAVGGGKAGGRAKDPGGRRDADAAEQHARACAERRPQRARHANEMRRIGGHRAQKADVARAAVQPMVEAEIHVFEERVRAVQHDRAAVGADERAARVDRVGREPRLQERWRRVILLDVQARRNRHRNVPGDDRPCDCADGRNVQREQHADLRGGGTCPELSRRARAAPRRRLRRAAATARRSCRTASPDVSTRLPRRRRRRSTVPRWRARIAARRQ